MQSFDFSYPTTVHFGEGALERSLPAELAKVGKTVMLAYGGGSIKRNGVYDAVMGLLAKADKDMVEFAGIMPNPTYAKVQEGAKLAREKGVDFILAVGGGSVIDCVKIVSVQAKTDRDVWKMEFSDHEFPTEGIPMGAVAPIPARRLWRPRRIDGAAPASWFHGAGARHDAGNRPICHDDTGDCPVCRYPSRPGGAPCRTHSWKGCRSRRRRSTTTSTDAARRACSTGCSPTTGPA